MIIKIKIQAGKCFKIDVPESTRIRKLKEMLSHKYGDFFYNCSLLFKGIGLRDDYVLGIYGIEDGDVIFASSNYQGDGPPIVNQTYCSNINCMDKRGQIGEYFEYLIKGSNEGDVWGDGIYIDDSNIAKAAVLEGKCKLGEIKHICIKIIEGKSSYGSCTKNGISTSSWGNWYGSYIFE